MNFSGLIHLFKRGKQKANGKIITQTVHCEPIYLCNKGLLATFLVHSHVVFDLQMKWNDPFYPKMKSEWIAGWSIGHCLIGLHFKQCYQNQWKRYPKPQASNTGCNKMELSFKAVIIDLFGHLGVMKLAVNQTLTYLADDRNKVSKTKGYSQIQ